MATARTGGGRAIGLNRDVITKAALALADEQGQIPAIRAIAGQLGSSPMALYRHVPDKAALVQLLVDSVYSELDQVDLAACTTVRAVLSTVARHAVEVFARHSWFPREAAATPPLGTQGLDFTEHCLAALDAQGYSGQRASTALGAVMTYATGAALLAGPIGAPDIPANGADTSSPVILDAWPHVQAHALRDPHVDITQAGLEALISAL